MSPKREPDGLGTPKYPPFGFSVWFDRHGKGWCWRQRRPSEVKGHVNSGEGLGKRGLAVLAVRLELAYRGGIRPRPGLELELSDASDPESPPESEPEAPSPQ